MDSPSYWALIIIFFCFGLWPVALILLFIKLFAPDEKRKRTAPPPLRTTSERTGQAAAPTVQKSSGRAAQTARNVTRKPKMKKSNARLLQILGGILLFGAVIGGIEELGLVLTEGLQWLSELLQTVAIGTAGAGMFIAGRNMSAAIKRYARYFAVMGDRAAVPVEELARKLGYSYQQVQKDLQKMLDKDYFGADAYLNEELGYLFRTATADEELTRKRAEKAASARETEEGFSGILRNIRRANDRIADPVLSSQIDRLEDITARIFRAVEDDPAKRSRIDTFLNYYLPTTQKLLDSYAEFEAAGVEGENLRQAKENIRKTMENIVEGFAYQLDALYKADAMNVDNDIRVMETMLRRDTASVEKDFGLGGTAMQQKEE
ncbi:MAG: hypothetical protein E7445_05895 [Ruminococcaceae bacterium]|nr:hypothetical protein [Oscillospiraceae bacterium]